MARLLSLMSTGIPLPLGSVDNARSFVFVGNLVDLIEKSLAHPGAGRQIFMVSDGEDLSTTGLIRRLAVHSGREPRLLPVPIPLLRILGRVGEGMNHVLGVTSPLDTYAVERLTGSLSVDIGALRASLGWEPPCSVDAGLAATVSTVPSKGN
jgi:nucleoside-diphosphate-sugar epimerase